MRVLLLGILVAWAYGGEAALAQSQSREILRHIPEVVEPEPNGTVRTKTGGSRINFPIDPKTLPQNLSTVLSDACTRLKFNQRDAGKYFVPIPRPNAPVMRFGFAQGNGLNLYDPENLRGPDQVYLFDRDGTSECKVYVYPTVF